MALKLPEQLRKLRLKDRWQIDAYFAAERQMLTEWIGKEVKALARRSGSTQASLEAEAPAVRDNIRAAFVPEIEADLNILQKASRRDYEREAGSLFVKNGLLLLDALLVVIEVLIFLMLVVVFDMSWLVLVQGLALGLGAYFIGSLLFDIFHDRTDPDRPELHYQSSAAMSWLLLTIAVAVVASVAYIRWQAEAASADLYAGAVGASGWQRTLAQISSLIYVMLLVGLIVLITYLEKRTGFQYRLAWEKMRLGQRYYASAKHREEIDKYATEFLNRVREHYRAGKIGSGVPADSYAKAVEVVEGPRPVKPAIVPSGNRPPAES
jgi:hypothetical protein